jgi:hypothetical protein
MTDTIHVPNWQVSKEHESAFVRTFLARPELNYSLEYPTQERKGDRYIAATYPAQVVAVNIRYQWEEKNGGYWWGQASGSIALISEKTGERYKSGWRSEVIRDHFASWEMGDAPEYVRELMEATHPRTSIIVTEVPE